MLERPVITGFDQYSDSEASKRSEKQIWFNVLGIPFLPLYLLLNFIRDCTTNLTDRQGPVDSQVGENDSTWKNPLVSLCAHLYTKFTPPEPAFDKNSESLDDDTAKAIADSLVTRISGTGQVPDARRRSVRILQLRGDVEQRSTIKSPTSAAVSPEIAKRAKLRASWTGRSLVPSKPSKKTLILDLDETLIHSLSKGGKMSSGHMVEVKLGTHAILYYVHKRPHCDYFLERVSRWYDVVIFTASVQEYADPVIDWLERDRKYFKARYYRQHCTYRYGAYMKDLTLAEPDLSRAIIVDNSPLSYRLNEENAVPIEGWISDPSDRDLLYLVPVLQNLYMVNDVRSLLSLRQLD